MKNDISASRISVSVPSHLIARLLDLQSARENKYAPDLMVTSVLQKYLTTSEVNQLGQGRAGKRDTSDWSNDWIMFSAPPAVAKGKPPIAGKNSTMPMNNDWCIGCACPSEEL